MRGLIVDEGRLNGLLVDEAAQPLSDIVQVPGLGGVTSSPAFAVALAAANGLAAYFVWQSGWKVLGGVLGLTAAGGLAWNLFGKEG